MCNFRKLNKQLRLQEEAYINKRSALPHTKVVIFAPPYLKVAIFAPPCLKVAIFLLYFQYKLFDTFVITNNFMKTNNLAQRLCYDDGG